MVLSATVKVLDVPPHCSWSSRAFQPVCGPASRSRALYSNTQFGTGRQLIGCELKFPHDSGSSPGCAVAAFLSKFLILNGLPLQVPQSVCATVFEPLLLMMLTRLLICSVHECSLHAHLAQAAHRAHVHDPCGRRSSTI